MTNALVIVESPAKARTIAGYLGDGFVVESSIGHVRDLPRNAAEVPKTYRNEPWARIGIDVDNDFKPLYVVASDRKSQITKLKSLLARADELFLATDEDREGEAIAWHLLEVLNPRVPVKRMVFHEITRDAIAAAVESPRGIDRRMVDAQEARRLLDRLYGYEVSPVLWKKVMPQLSAGRVQSVATRIAVERERERMDFVSAGYWSLTGTFAALGSGPGAAGRFEASLSSVDGVRTAGGRDFGPDGRLSPLRRGLGRRGHGHRAGRAAGGRWLHRGRPRLQAVSAAALAPLHHLHLPAGGGPQAEDVGHRGHAGRPGPLREGLHHLHAHRQHHAVGRRGAGGPLRRGRALRPGFPAPQAPLLRRQG